MMRIPNTNLMILLAIFSAILGCDAKQGKPLKANNQGNLRLRLLERIQGQDVGAKLVTLLDIAQHDPDVAFRRDALHYMAALGTEAKPVADAIAKQLIIESDAYVVNDLKQVLVECDANVENYLLSAAVSANAPQLLRIIETLGEIKASSSQALEFLQRHTLGDKSDIAIAACKSIRRIGTAAQTTLPTLISVAERPRIPLVGSVNDGRDFRESRDLTQVAMEAIAAVGANQSALAVLTDALSMEPQIAAVAANAIADLGPAAASALPALKQLQSRDDHGGKDVKTRLAREAASLAISVVQNVNAKE